MLASFFGSSKDTTPTTRDVPWPPVDPPAPHPGPKSALPAWSPAVFRPGTKRSSRNVTELSCGVLDFDDAAVEDLRRLLAELQGTRALVHSTWSHTPAVPRFRVVVAFSRPVPAEVWSDVWARLASRYGATADPACSDAARLYYGAYHPQGATSFYHLIDGEPLDWTTLPPASTVVRLRDLRALAARWRRSKVRAHLGEALGAVVDGEPYAQPGERHNTLRDLAWGIVQTWPRVEARSCAALFSPSLSHPDMDEPGAPTTLEVEHLIQSARDKIEADTTEQGQAPERIREAWRTAGVERETPYTPEELARMAVHDHAWIVEHAGAVWLRGPGGYVGPYRDKSATIAALVALAPSPCKLYVPTSTGTRPATLPELLEAHGRSVSRLVYDATITETRLALDGDELQVAICKRRDLEPAFCPEVAEWLRALAGSEWPHLALWLAHVTHVDRPCAALFLHGPRGTGKSLLGEQLARIWSEQGPTPLEHAIGSYNAPLARCPLIFADERVPREFADRAKALISERERLWTQKYMPAAPMRGAVRLVIAANNTKFFEALGDLSSNDVEALAERFVFLDVQPEAARVLRKYDVIRWVREDRIPRFALWLAQNHPDPTPQGRFIVCTSNDRFYRSLSVSSGLRSAIVQWCVGFLTDPAPILRAYGKATPDRVDFTPEGVYVTANAIYARWGQYVTDGLCPSISRVASALRELGPEVRLPRSKSRGRLVSIDLLCQWSKDTGSADPEKLIDLLHTRKDLDQP